MARKTGCQPGQIIIDGRCVPIPVAKGMYMEAAQEFEISENNEDWRASAERMNRMLTIESILKISHPGILKELKKETEGLTDSERKMGIAPPYMYRGGREYQWDEEFGDRKKAEEAVESSLDAGWRSFIIPAEGKYHQYIETEEQYLTRERKSQDDANRVSRGQGGGKK